MTDRNRPISILDHGTVLDIGYEDCVKYHGRTSIGGVALGYRLMQRAIADLSPGKIPDRSDVRVATLFPGPGFRDALEMIARVVTEGRYRIDDTLDLPDAPEAVVGRLGFEVSIGTAIARYVAIPGAMNDEFIRLGRLSKTGEARPEDDERWTVLKEALAETLLTAPLETAFRRI